MKKIEQNTQIDMENLYWLVMVDTGIFVISIFNFELRFLTLFNINSSSDFNVSYIPVKTGTVWGGPRSPTWWNRVGDREVYGLGVKIDGFWLLKCGSEYFQTPAGGKNTWAHALVKQAGEGCWYSFTSNQSVKRKK